MVLLEFLVKMIEMNTYSVGVPVGLVISTLVFVLYKTYMVIPWKIILLKECHKKLEPKKKELFEEATSRIESQLEDERCEVLEIGVGTGENFKFFPANSNVTILDNTDKWMSSLKGNLLLKLLLFYLGNFDLTRWFNKRWKERVGYHKFLFWKHFLKWI